MSISKFIQSSNCLIWTTWNIFYANIITSRFFRVSLFHYSPKLFLFSFSSNYYFISISWSASWLFYQDGPNMSCTRDMCISSRLRICSVHIIKPPTGGMSRVADKIEIYVFLNPAKNLSRKTSMSFRISFDISLFFLKTMMIDTVDEPLA